MATPSADGQVRVSRVNAQGELRVNNKLASVLVTFVRSHPGACSGFMLLALGRATLRALLLPRYQGLLVQAMSDARASDLPGAVRDILRAVFTGGDAPSASVGVPLLQFVATLVGTVLSTIAYDYASAELLPMFVADLRKYLIYDQLEKHERDISRLDAATALTDLCTVPDVCRGWFELLLTNIIPYGITFVVGIAYITALDPAAGGFAFGLLACVAVASVMTVQQCARLSAARYRIYSSNNSYVQNRLENLISVYLDNAMHVEAKTMTGLEHTLRRAMRKLCMRATHWMLSTRAYLVVVALPIVWLSTRTWLRGGGRDIGRFVTILVLLMILLTVLESGLSGLYDITYALGVLRESLGTFSYKRYSALRDEFGGGRDGTSLPPSPPLQPRVRARELGDIRFERVTFGFAGRPVLRDVSFTIRAGSTFGIVGRSGSGKTTIARLIMGFYNLQHAGMSGRVWIGARDLHDIPVRNLRAHIGYLAQSTTLYDLTVIENILFGNTRNVTRADVEALIKRADLRVFDTLADGLDTRAGRGMNSGVLSGGQRQIVLLLRVMLRRDPILILDEPTAALDPVSADTVVQLLQHMRNLKDRTMIVVTHDARLRPIFDETLDMSAPARV